MKSIRVKFTVGILIIVSIGFTFAGGFCYWVSRNALIESNLQKGIYASAYQAEVFDRWLDSQMFLVETYAEVVKLYNTTEDIYRICLDVANSSKDFLAVYATFSNGGGIFSDDWIPDDGWDATERPWYIKAMEYPDDVILVTPYYDPSTYETIITISKYAGTFNFMDMVFSIDIEISDLLNIMTTVDIAENGYVFLSDNEGIIVTHDEDEYKPIGDVSHHMREYDQYLQVYDTLSLGQDYVKVMDYDGVSRYFISSYLASADWVLYMAVPETSMYEAFDQQMRWVLLAFVLVLAVLFLCLMVLADRLIVKRLILLANTSEMLAGGDLNIKVEDRSMDEIGALSRSFGRVANTFHNVLGDLDQMSAYHSGGDYEFRMNAQKYAGAYQNVVDKINDMAALYSDNLMDILGALQQFGQGNFNADIKQYPGKLGICNEVVLSLKTNLENVVEEIDKIAEAAVNGQLSTRVDTEKFQGDWLGIMEGLNNVLEAIAIPIQEASNVLLEISDGNLNVRMNGDYRGDFAQIKHTMDKTTYALSTYISEISNVLDQLANNNYDQEVTLEFVGDFAQIKNSINKIIRKLNQVLNSIIRTSEQVLDGSRQVLLSSGKLAMDSDNQAHVVSRLDEYAGQIREQAQSNAENSQKVNKLTNDSRDNAIVSRKEIDRMRDSMEAVQKAADNISSIMKVINGIAFQTNLLAINAAVEASRAGEHGKGFGVVADEIRELSARSTAAARETEALIENTIQAVEVSTNIVQKTSSSFDELIDDIESISDYISEISKASEEQAYSVTEVVKSISQISVVAENSRVISMDGEATAKELSANSDMLSNSLSVFRFKKDETP